MALRLLAKGKTCRVDYHLSIPCPIPHRSMVRLGSILVCLFMLSTPQLADRPAHALEAVPEFGDNPGRLSMFLHKPGEFQERLPLVVALHGCTQSAGQFDDETGLVALADEIPFVLVLPEQRPENMNRNCFRWYDRRDNRPGLGESASILSMIDAVIGGGGVDPDRVYVLGLSAGGAMTAVLLAN